MQRLYRRLSGWAYRGDTFVARWRRARMQAFLSRVVPPSGARIIDLGGGAHLWNLFEHDFKITIVNLKLPKHMPDDSRFSWMEGDACDLSAEFPDQSFDLAFSNSVIEHVGDAERQEAFSREVRRLARGYWVQTPSDSFPIEPHSGVPFYWKLPTSLRGRLQRGWQKRLPGWSRSMLNTRVLTCEQLQGLFPRGELYRERVFGLTKSYAVYRSCD